MSTSKNQKLSNRPQNKNFGERAGRAEGERQHEKYKSLYYENPKFCKHCGKLIPYEKKENNFCNRSCACTFNNLKSPRRKKQETILKRGEKIPHPSLNYCKVTFRQCPTCNNHFLVRGARRKYCSGICNPNNQNISRYRILCAFSLNKKDHPELFDGKLITEYGWYQPTNRGKNTNLTGVTWDHLFKITDGFKMKIDPKIMSHPANAELVPWKENYNRNSNGSLITFQELLERIELWNSGDKNLPKFYSE